MSASDDAISKMTDRLLAPIAGRSEAGRPIIYRQAVAGDWTVWGTMTRGDAVSSARPGIAATLWLRLSDILAQPGATRPKDGDHVIATDSINGNVAEALLYHVVDVEYGPANDAMCFLRLIGPA